MPRRKPGTLVPLELEILEAALAMADQQGGGFHGFGLAAAMRERAGSRSLTGHGTLYKALGRLEELGMLTSAWEDAELAQGRPRRRLYELTAKGAEAARVASAATPAAAAPGSPRPRAATRVATEAA